MLKLKHKKEKINMPHESDPTQNPYEGWRQLTPGRANDFAGEVNSVLPSGKTGAETLDEVYGPGNWVFDDSKFAAEYAAEREFVAANNEIAREGRENLMAHYALSDALGEPRKQPGDVYVDDDGNRLTGKIVNQVTSSPMGHILISPEGDEHLQKYLKGKEQ